MFERLWQAKRVLVTGVAGFLGSFVVREPKKRQAAERYSAGAPINLGSGMEISIRDLVHLIARLARFEGEILWDASKLGGQPRRCADISKAEQPFGFEARTSFEQGLRSTISWNETVFGQWHDAETRARHE